MRSLKIDNTTGETLVSVRWVDEARDVGFIAILVVANGKLVGTNRHDRTCMVLEL